MAAWAAFYDIEPSESDEALYTRCWGRVKGTATARRLDPIEYGRTLMRAFQEYGRTFTAPYTWSASPALFDKQFTQVVSWATAGGPKPKAPQGPPPAPPAPKPASSRRPEEDPGYADRVRQLAAQGVNSGRG